MTGERWFTTSWRTSMQTLTDTAGRRTAAVSSVTTRAVAEVTDGRVAAMALADSPACALAAARGCPRLGGPVAPALAAPAPPPPAASPSAPLPDLLTQLCDAVNGRVRLPLRTAFTATNVRVQYCDSAGVNVLDERRFYTVVVSHLDPRRHWLATAATGDDVADLGSKVSADLAWMGQAERGTGLTAEPTVVLRGQASREFLYAASLCPLAAELTWLIDEPRTTGASRRRAFDDAGFDLRSGAFSELAATTDLPSGRLRLSSGRPALLLTALRAMESARQRLAGEALVVESVVQLNDAAADGVAALLARPAWVIRPDGTAIRHLSQPVLLTGKLSALSLAPLDSPLPESLDEPTLVIAGFTSRLADRS